MASKRQNWLRPGWITTTMTAAITAVFAGGLLLAPSPPVQAVHASPYTFELDGNIASDGLPDWASEMPFLASQDEAFFPDAGGNGGKEPTAYKGSNKDIDAINTWEYENSKVTPDKDNITNAYALARTVDVLPGPGTEEHQVIYFGADRYSNNGDAALGFWFFQDNVGPGPNGVFQGTHVARSADGPGDILVQVDFSPNPDATKPPTFEIQIFEWVGSGGSHGALDEIEFVSTQGNIVCIGDSGATDHDDAACATTNAAIELNSPWSYRAKDTKFADNVMPRQSFFEGGIDITELVGNVCFSSYLAETRSSHSETAELKDFAGGEFELCSIDLVGKQCLEDDVAPYLSPRYNSDTGLYETVHRIEINNDGPGILHNVQINDSTIGSNLECDIVSINFEGPGGTLPDPTLTLPKSIVDSGDSGTSPADEWIEVANTLAKDGTVKVDLFCKSGLNQRQNTASVRAAPSETAGLTVTDDPYSEGIADVANCGVTLEANLLLTKYCANQASKVVSLDTNGDGIPDANLTVTNPLYNPITDLLAVTLNPDNQYKPRVCVDIRLQNTSSPAQRLVIDSIFDHEGYLPDGPDADGDPDPVLFNLMDAFKTANNGNGSACDNILNNGVVDCNTLLPDEVVAFARCYDPVGPDGGATNPGLAEYTDTVTVDAHGISLGTVEDATDSATCKLCPTCPTCPSAP